MKPKLTAKNKAIVERAIKLILEEPRRFDMLTFGVIAPEEVRVGDVFNDLVKPPCGTVACLAGWISVAAETKRGKLPTGETMNSCLRNAEDRAAQILGETVNREYGYAELDKVFMVSAWPLKFQQEYSKYGRWGNTGPTIEKVNHLKAAKVAVKRLRYFLRTGE